MKAKDGKRLSKLRTSTKRSWRRGKN